ncbi:uncharacterized protein LOC112084638 isoform X2 [Eutrema salsugineum]|uniref:uncharacterized protein LOC112084638 isoform X2 n=1 Tax=Eutrema salsugineum TaxID=72664 RepID=UPI000CED1752|nr:uncharacterized protein LOC112084638 isoform X2 [Eutrema salsugineum]
MARTTFWWRISAASSLGGQQQRIETPSSRKGQSSKASVVEQVQGVQLADKPAKKKRWRMEPPNGESRSDGTNPAVQVDQRRIKWGSNRSNGPKSMVEWNKQ